MTASPISHDSFSDDSDLHARERRTRPPKQALVLTARLGRRTLMMADAHPSAPHPLLLPLPGWRGPLEILPAFASDPMPALLFSGGPGPAGADINRWSFLCASPFQVISWTYGQPGDPFRLLEDATCRHAMAPAGGFPFAGGAVGYIGYDAGRAVESILCRAEADLGLPDMLFGLYSWAIVWDHDRKVWAVISSGLPEAGAAREDKARTDAARVCGRLETYKKTCKTVAKSPDERLSGEPAPPVPLMSSSVTRARYLEMVEEAKRLISAGDLYQVNLSQRLELAATPDPAALFAALALHSPAPFSAYLDPGPFQVVSASPERFVRLRGRRAESRPIKGTRPRGQTPEQDASLLRELMHSSKDRAENIMIVDLVRNDLGRVCRPATVSTPRICSAESYASVHHLVSVVEGELAQGCDRADLLRALFPGGSMTGAPKVRAMQAIEDLEPVRRGIYSGALGYLSFCGAMDMSIVIRTAIVAKGRTWLQVGGGVVADSDPEAEYRESLDKAKSVLRALAAALA